MFAIMTKYLHASYLQLISSAKLVEYISRSTHYIEALAIPDIPPRCLALKSGSENSEDRPYTDNGFNPPAQPFILGRRRETANEESE